MAVLQRFLKLNMRCSSAAWETTRPGATLSFFCDYSKCYNKHDQISKNMWIHTSQKQETFQERYCNLCNEKYVPTGGTQKYCLRCKKVKRKETISRYKKRRYRGEKLRIALENQLRALDTKPGDRVQVSIENNKVIVTRLPSLQPKQ